MKVVIPVVVEMTDEQVAAYANEYGLTPPGSGPYVREIAADIREYVLGCVQESAAFGEIGDGYGTRGAEVSIRR